MFNTIKTFMFYFLFYFIRDIGEWLTHLELIIDVPNLFASWLGLFEENTYLLLV